MAEQAWINESYKPYQETALRRLLELCYGAGAVSQEYWHWRYESHVRFRAEICIARRGEEILGVQPVALFDATYRSGPVKVAMLTGAMTHPQHRRRGIFRSLVEQATDYAFQAGAAVVFTMPNQSSFAAFMRMGNWLTPGFRRLSARPLNLRSLARTILPNPHLADALVVIPQAFLAARIPQASGRFEITPVTRWSQDTARVFEQFSANYAGLILRRDPDYLNWRYADNPVWDYKMLLALDARAQPVGFAVAVTDQRFGLRIGYIVDMLTVPDSGCQAAIIQAVLRNMHDRGVHAVGTTTTDHHQQRDLAEAGFYCPPVWLVPKRFYLAYRVRRDVASYMSGLRKLSGWFLNFGDWDTL